MTQKREPLCTGSEWTFELLEQMYDEIERIATDKYGLDTYPNQVDIINSEMMLDAYTSNGLPIQYHHWSFGKNFVQQQEMYKRGYMGLAYEIVINSDPCISYLMEENNMMMQTLVMAHAAFGHNAFFKNNYLFKQWTEADAILDYLKYAKKFVSDCEERYGVDQVEYVLDAAHALKHHGISKYKRPQSLSPEEEEQRRQQREEEIQAQLNDLWRETIYKDSDASESFNTEDIFPEEPEENILYFIEQNAPRLDNWKRELIRIVRKLSQYFYPQMQTKMMNEGFATFMHYNIMHDLYDEGIIPRSYMLDFYRVHTNVIAQPSFNDQRYSGINPYALGFAIFQDIKRICTEPTEEDYEWFPNYAGKQDWLGTVKWAMESFKDESFVRQFLSPKVIRDFKLFSIIDDENDPKIEVEAIQNERGYKRVRSALADRYDINMILPDIQVSNVDLWGSRKMTLTHYMHDRKPLEQKSTTEVLKHVAYLWGYNVELQTLDMKTKNVVANYRISDDERTLSVPAL